MYHAKKFTVLKWKLISMKQSRVFFGSTGPILAIDVIVRECYFEMCKTVFTETIVVLCVI